MHRINFYFSNVNIRLSLGLIYSSLCEAIRVLPLSVPCQRWSFEKDVRSVIGIAHAVAVPAARSGLYALFSALGVRAGDEVIVTGYTCSAVAEPIIQSGAKPIYVDICRDTFCLDPSAVAMAITPNTRVIIVQHTYGLPGPIEQVIRIAQQRGIFVIEDCALAFGSKKDGRWLGTFADAAVWSFELSKTISVGWGGLVGINRDAELAVKVRQLIEAAGFKGRWRTVQQLLQGGLSGLMYHHNAPLLFRHYGLGALFKFRIFRSSADTPASNLCMPSDYQWKYLRCQFKRLNRRLAKSQEARAAYEAVLTAHGYESVFQRCSEPDTYLIRLPLLVQNVSRFVEFFALRGIEIGRWFSSTVSADEGLPTRYGYSPGSCPIAEDVCRHIVNLPLHGRLTSSQVAMIASVLDAYLSAYPSDLNDPSVPNIAEVGSK